MKKTIQNILENVNLISFKLGFVINIRKVNDFKQQANWHKALALLVTNEPQKAKVLFEEIVTNEWFNHEKATEILDGM